MGDTGDVGRSAPLSADRPVAGRDRLLAAALAHFRTAPDVVAVFPAGSLAALRSLEHVRFDLPGTLDNELQALSIVTDAAGQR